MNRFFVFLIFSLMAAFAKAQCSMCRAVIETQGSDTLAKGLNNGITYMMAFPYLLIGGIIYMIYRSNRKKSA